MLTTNIYVTFCILYHEIYQWYWHLWESELGLEKGDLYWVFCVGVGIWGLRWWWWGGWGTWGLWCLSVERDLWLALLHHVFVLLLRLGWRSSCKYFLKILNINVAKLEPKLTNLQIINTIIIPISIIGSYFHQLWNLQNKWYFIWYRTISIFAEQ